MESSQVDGSSTSELSWFVWQEVGESINEASAGCPTPATYMSNPIASLTYDFRVLPASHTSFPLLRSLSGIQSHASQAWLHLIPAWFLPILRFSVELGGILDSTPGKIEKMQGACLKKPNVGLLSAFTGGSNSCGGVISSLSGSFSSPWYPANYPTNVECVWVIQVAEKFHIKLMIPSLK